MRSLFAKIFLSFFVTVLVLGLFLQLSTITRSTMMQSTPVRRMVADVASSSASAWTQGGSEALDQALSALPLSGVLFDARGRPVRDVPADQRDVAASAETIIQKNGRLADLYVSGDVAVQPVTLDSGARFYLALRVPRERFGAVLATLDEHPFIRVSILVLVAGAVCWLLAGHITRPLVRLGAAAGRMADGRLDARAGAPLTKRRDEIGALGRDFDQMAERLSALVQSERQLLADVSHELRSPLARLTVAAGLVRQRLGPSEELDRIDREVGRLDALIGQSLTLARLESGVGAGVPETLDLTALVQSITADGDFEARAMGKRVMLTAADGCSLTGVSDLICSAIENVVRNAIRHTAASTAVEIALRATGGSARVTVRDHGPGIPEAQLQDVFLPFRRADAPGRPPSTGAGLGLAIADRIVRMHGGTIAAANAADGGLIVTIVLKGSHTEDAEAAQVARRG